MKRKLPFHGNRCVLLILVLLYSLYSFGQFSLRINTIETGINISPSNFLGDLGGNYGKGGPFLKDNNISNTKILAGAHITVYPNHLYGIRLAFTYGTIAGDDANINGRGGLEEARKARNQNFKSKIAEVFVAAEIYPTVLLEQDPTDVFHQIRPYFILGAGVFHFNPRGRDLATNEWVYLKPLHTEGQGFPEYPDRKEYKLTQFNIPMGIGIKYFLSEDVNLGIEMISRKTFTDYIDDVSTTYIDNNLFYSNLPLNTAVLAERMYDKTAGSQNRSGESKRGSPANMDSYYSGGIKLSFRIGGDGNTRNSMKCPKVWL